MKNNASLIYSVVLLVGDFLALVAAFVGGYIIRGQLYSAPVAHPITAATYVGIFLSLLPFWLLIFGLLGLYNSSIYEKRFAEMGRLAIGSFVGLLFVSAYAYASNTPVFPSKLVPVYSFLLAFLLLVIVRNSARYLHYLLFRYDIGITNVLLVGNTKIAQQLVEILADRHLSGYRIVGVVGNKSHSPKRYPHILVFDDFDEAIKTLDPDEIHGIVQTELYAAGEKNNQIVDFAQTHHISYRFVPGNSELFVGNIAVELFRGQVPVIAVHQTALIGWGRIVKRLFDLVFGILFFLIALPFMLIIGLINLFASGGVFFRQDRLTRFNQKFRVYKFRSQYKKYDGTTPEQAFALMGEPELAKVYRRNGDFLANDPRITRFGHFLRATSLDELPQLLNVVKGDLSLVGPRALIPEELSEFEKRHTILSVKSGVTGLAQVSGRKQLPFNERRQLDLYYVQNWSLWLDITILIKTIKAVLSGNGAK